MWKVRAEIIGEFVINDTYATREEAEKRVDELEAKGYWDNVDCWEIGGK